MKHATSATAILLTFIATVPAWSAGYGLKEQSATAMGSAYAGVAADTANPAALGYNPATLSGVVDTDGAFSVVEIVPHSSASYASATTAAGTAASGSRTPSSFIADAPVPSLNLRHRLNDDWAIGLNVSAPFGLKTQYPSSWAGRYYALETEEITVKIAPTVAWQVTPQLSLGASLNVEYSRGVLTSAIDFGTLGVLNGVPGSVPGAIDGSARLSGISWNEGFSVGAVWQPAPDWSLGVSYESAVPQTLGGSLTYALDPVGLGAGLRAATGLFTNTRGTARLTMPDMVRAGVRHQLSDNFTLMAEFDWTGWSRFQNLTVVAQNPVQPNDVTMTSWHDAVFASLGGEYRLDDQWKLRGGVGYDESPIPDSTRSPRIPDANRTWLSVGVGYNILPSTTLDLSYGHLFNDDVSIAQSAAQTGNALRGGLTGTSSSSVDVIGLQVSSAL